MFPATEQLGGFPECGFRLETSTSAVETDLLRKFRQQDSSAKHHRQELLRPQLFKCIPWFRGFFELILCCVESL
jgi:hypothetical protein